MRNLPTCKGRLNILGVGISSIDMKGALSRIDTWIRLRDRQYVCVTGVHGVMESQINPRLKKIHNHAGLVTPDGMPLVWLNKLAGNKWVTRVYGPDLMLAVFSQGIERGYKHFLYGGGPGVAEKLAKSLQEKFPGAQIVGCYTPPFGPLSEDEDQKIVETINSANPDIVWVGLSTPKQEMWMYDHRDKLDAPVLIGVGAAFDFHAGLKAQAPEWMRQAGLEWLFRLVTEPRRLWKRYLRNNPLFIWSISLQILGLRKYPCEW